MTSGFDEFGGSNDVTVQAEYMVPNYPMFADGTTPFIGDYVDVAAPNLIYDEANGWRFASQPGDVTVWQAVWADNRDVVPPPDGDWGKYVAPITQAQPSLFDPSVILPSCNDVTFPNAPAAAPSRVALHRHAQPERLQRDDHPGAGGCRSGQQPTASRLEWRTD